MAVNHISLIWIASIFFGATIFTVRNYYDEWWGLLLTILFGSINAILLFQAGKMKGATE